MPNIATHTDYAAPVFLGVGAIISHGVLQAEFIVTFLCAVFGSGIGMAFLPAPVLSVSRWELAKRFFGNALYILLTSIVTMFGLHLLNVLAAIEIKEPSLLLLLKSPAELLIAGKYAVGFFTSLALMLFRERIISALGRLVERKIDGA